MKLNLTDVFCELISGVAIMLTVVPILDLLRVLRVSDAWQALLGSPNLTTLTVVLGVSYMVGVIFDGIAMSSDTWLARWLKVPDVPHEASTDFWRRVQPHVLSYRSETWAFYFCYRNLFLLLPVAAVAWSVWLLLHYSFCLAAFAFAALLGMAFLLSRGMREIYKLYNTITIGAAAAPDATPNPPRVPPPPSAMG